MTAVPGTAAVPLPAEIRELHVLGPDTSLFRLIPDSPAKISFIPGQFVQLSVPYAGEIPVSIAGSGDGCLDLCVRRVGHVTAQLHRLGQGDRVWVRGPFGTGFPLDRWEGRDIVLMAGGLGMAPLRSLLLALLMRRQAYGSMALLYGSRDPATILFADELAALGIRKDLQLLLTVDSGGAGAPSVLRCRTGLLPDLLAEVAWIGPETVAAVCGPPAVYPPVIGRLKEAGVPPDAIFLSLERHMKCGVGHCCHCAVGSLLCCTDGPVFSLARLEQAGVAP